MNILRRVLNLLCLISVGILILGIYDVATTTSRDGLYIGGGLVLLFIALNYAVFGKPTLWNKIDK